MTGWAQARRVQPAPIQYLLARGERCSATVLARGERGSATVLGLGVIGVVLTLWLGAMMLGAVMIASNRARTAADLAAIGGAQTLRVGGDLVAACARAQQVARDNGSDRAECTSTASGSAAERLTVEVLVEVSTGIELWPMVQARAHAGLVPRPP